MSRRSFPQRVILVLLLATVLTAPSVMAAQPRPRTEKNPATLVVALVLELRAQLWGFLSGFWEKEGCSIDPHGGSLCGNGSTAVVPVQGDEGCGIDPHGGSLCGNGSPALEPVQGDAGCSIDPHGGCGH